MIYLASPYTHISEEIMEHRYELASRACAGLFRQGIAVHSPIVHWHEVAKEYDLPRDYRPWRTQNKAAIKACLAVWVLSLEGWRESSGVANDIRLAHKYKRPQRMVSMDECLRGVKYSSFEQKEDEKSKD